VPQRLGLASRRVNSYDSKRNKLTKKMMMEESLEIRTAGIFVIFFVSLAGCLSMLSFGGTGKGSEHQAFISGPWYLLLRCFASGIMLGVAFIHLLADASESLTAVSEDFPALATTVATIGVLLVLTTEQVAIFLLTPNTHGNIAGRSSVVAARTKHVPECELSNVEAPSGADCSCEPLALTDASGTTPPPTPLRALLEVPACCTSSANGSSMFDNNHNLNHDHDHGHDHGHYQDHELNCAGHNTIGGGHSHHFHSLALATTSPGASESSPFGDLPLMIKAVVMELAIAMHSVIIGVSFGALGSMEELVGLLVALSFHQLFEGIALGTALQSARSQLGEWKTIGFAFTFAITTPIGIVIGMLALPTDGEPSVDQEYSQGILNALAAGNLIYIALVEMISADFSSPLAIKNSRLRALMLGALCAGDLVMAILAIWA